MPFVISATAIAQATRSVHPFAGQVAHRQLLAQASAGLWAPTSHARRWNTGFATLYTSLLLDVALAERVKRSLARPVQLVVGIARVSIARVLNFELAAVRRSFGLAEDALTTEEYGLTQRLGAALFDAGITGLLVPAAIATTAAYYPSFRFTSEGRTEVRPTPRGGTNLVIFTDKLNRGDGYPETGRFRCEIAGLPA